jgi:O-antigen/teichoic acid export membrane protein
MALLPRGFVARGAVGSLVIKLGNLGLSFLVQMGLARLMGADSYGVYIYALTWLNVLALLAGLGTDGLLTRFAAAYSAKQEWGLLKGLVRYGYGAVLLSCAVLGLAAWAALEFLGADWAPERQATFLAALALLPVSALWSVGQALLFGLKRPWQAQLPEMLSRVAMLGLAGAAFWQLGGVSAPLAMACGAVAGLCGLLLGSFWLIRALPRAAARAAFAAREWLGVSLPLLFMAGLRFLLNRSDLLLMGWLLNDPAAVGAYAIAARLAELATFGQQAANTTLAPTISELHATGQRDRLQGVVTRTAQGVFAFTLTVSLTLALGGEWALGLFGPGFAAAYFPLLILLAGQTINAMTGSVGYLMTMTGHQRAAAWRVALSALVTVALNVALIPRYGLNGAALASALGTAVLNLSMLVFVGARLKINSTVFRSKRYGKA